MIFAIDFDGTIVEHEYPEIGPEIPGAVNTLKDLQAKGHKIIIYTCRVAPRLAPIVEWFEMRGFRPDAINRNVVRRHKPGYAKIMANVYIDDRNFPPFPGWEMVRQTFLPETAPRFAEG